MLETSYLSDICYRKCYSLPVCRLTTHCLNIVQRAKIFILIKFDLLFSHLFRVLNAIVSLLIFWLDDLFIVESGASSQILFQWSFSFTSPVLRVCSGLNYMYICNYLPFWLIDPFELYNVLLCFFSQILT
jgi:hypothetical protein